MRKIRFAVKAIINTGAYEAIHVELDETVEIPEGKDANAIRNRLMYTVTQTVEDEVLRHRRDLEMAHKVAANKKEPR
jgi:hypothetical protein